MYNTLLHLRSPTQRLASCEGRRCCQARATHLISTSPRFPENVPSTHSSVLASCKFMYRSTDARYPAHHRQRVAVSARSHKLMFLSDVVFPERRTRCGRRPWLWPRRAGRSCTSSCSGRRRQPTAETRRGVSLSRTFVLHAPLQLHDARLPRQLLQERLRVDRHVLRRQPHTARAQPSQRLGSRRSPTAAATSTHRCPQVH